MKKFPLFSTVNYIVEFEKLETEFRSKAWTQTREDKLNEDKHTLRKRSYDTACALRKGIQDYIDDALGISSRNYAVSTLRTEGRYSFLIYTEADEKGYPMCEVFIEPNGLVNFLYYIRGGFSDDACNETVWMNDPYMDSYHIEGRTQSLTADEVCEVVEKTAECFKQWFQQKSRRISNPVYQIIPLPSTPSARSLVFDFFRNSYVTGCYLRSA